MPNIHVLIVDPIFRGSRLMYSAYAAAALVERGARVTLLTRTGPETDHYHELFKGIPHTLKATIPTPLDTWYCKLSADVIRACLSQVAALQSEHHFLAVFFSGWNEFFPRIALNSCRKLPTDRKRWFFVDYSPAFWLCENETQLASKISNAIKRHVTSRVLKRNPDLHFLVLDERLKDADFSRLPPNLQGHYHLLPEASPWAGEPVPASLKDDVELLLVGLQTRRKGLADVLAILSDPDFPPRLRVRLVGRLGAELAPLRAKLQALPPNRFSWEEVFLSELEIRQRYAKCDYVLVPYTREFQSTSSVLAWAGAHGKPVIATDHGVVGYRVAKHKLGILYPSGDTSKLAAVLRGLPRAGSPHYQDWSRSCAMFAADCRIEIFKSLLGSTILDMR